jgi:hypothetical protein
LIGSVSCADQLCVGLGECCLGTRRLAPKSETLGLNSCLRHVDPLSSREEDHSSSWNQSGPPEEGFEVSSVAPSGLGENRNAVEANATRGAGISCRIENLLTPA